MLKWAQILWGFRKFQIKHLLKISPVLSVYLKNWRIPSFIYLCISYYTPPFSSVAKKFKILRNKPTFWACTWIGFQQHLFTHVEHHGGVLPGGGPTGQKGHSVDGDIIVKCWHHIYEVILSVSFKHLKIIEKIRIENT